MRRCACPSTSCSSSSPSSLRCTCRLWPSTSSSSSLGRPSTSSRSSDSRSFSSSSMLPLLRAATGRALCCLRPQDAVAARDLPTNRRARPEASREAPLVALVGPFGPQKLGERVEERDRHLGPLALERVQRGGEPGHRSGLAAATLQDLLGAPGALDEVECDRGLVGEQSQQ